MGSKDFCVGFLQDITCLTNSGNKSFLKLKEKLTRHLQGASPSGHAHLEAVINMETKEEEIERNVTALQNIVSAGLSTVKMGSAGIQHESSLALLASAGADIGTLNHSRYV